ncbi:protein mab-21-like 3 [Mauremys reevesii]|uniref:protein mab-21-like 3 n=1 Tax=Mauremys reevesii TaxID=260615 RepID=UPI00193FD5DF|nr:protein mab-21-like 3 [Mauremys reevesii]
MFLHNLSRTMEFPELGVRESEFLGSSLSSSTNSPRAHGDEVSYTMSERHRNRSQECWLAAPTALTTRACSPPRAGREPRSPGILALIPLTFALPSSQICKALTYVSCLLLTPTPLSCSPQGNIRLENTVSITPISPAVQLTAEVNGQAVSIDLVPTIRNKVDMSMDWPQQDLRWLSDWWEREQGTEQRKPTWNIMEIYKTGTDLVAKNSYWRLTFSLAETQLLRDNDADGGCRREALQVLKQINMEKWVACYGKVLTSYHLKMVLFWASHLNPETENWAMELDALGALLKVLEFCLEKRHLPSYFLPSINFFDWHRTEEENSLKNLVLEALRLEVRLMRCSPQLYLQRSYDLAKPQSPGPFMQRARELNEFRREHQKDFEAFKNLKISFDTSLFREL